MITIWISTAPGQVHAAMINKLEDAYQIVRQAVVEFVFHLAEVHEKSSKEHSEPEVTPVAFVQNVLMPF